MDELGDLLEEEQTFLNESASRGRMQAERDMGMNKEDIQAPPVSTLLFHVPTFAQSHFKMVVLAKNHLNLISHAPRSIFTGWPLVRCHIIMCTMFTCQVWKCLDWCSSLSSSVGRASSKVCFRSWVQFLTDKCSYFTAVEAYWKYNKWSCQSLLMFIGLRRVKHLPSGYLLFGNKDNNNVYNLFPKPLFLQTACKS